MINDVKICKICGKELAKNAKVCPNCGQDQRNFFARHKVLSGLGILVILGVIGSFNSNSNKPTEIQQSAQEVKKEVKIEENINPEITVSAVDLIKEYANNEVKADQMYKGKVARITGIVDGIDSDMSDDAVVRLSDGSEFSITNVHCYIKSSDKEKAATLAKGQNVTIIGKLNGEVVGSPCVKDCTIE